MSLAKYEYEVLMESGNIYHVWADDEYQAICKVEVAHDIPQAWRQNGRIVWNAY